MFSAILAGPRARHAFFTVPCHAGNAEKRTAMSNSKTLLGVLAGLAAGAAIGLLLAPRSGKETRDILRNKGRQAKDDLNDLFDAGFDEWQRLRKNMTDRAHMTKDDLKDFLDFMAAEGADLKRRMTQRREAQAAQQENTVGQN
ncbi:MAG: YtxH domain-containing protein [Flavobacteriales bacterium]|nr:YtxH domain-containing protein [Flavobacteriales bacterium]